MLSSFIAVDTETTGLDFEHDRVIELAAVRFEDGKPVADFTALLSPGERSLSPVSRLITGLNDAELAAAPPAAETLRAFLDFAGDAPLVAHNAEFDANFVRKSLEAAGLPQLPGAWIDSLLLSRIAWPMWDSHRLDSLAERLKVPRDAEHRALPDARRAGHVFVAAQNFVRDNLSAQAWNDLAGLSAELPDWSLVFSPEDGNSTASPLGEQDYPPPAGAVEDDAARTAAPESAEEIAGALASALASEGWLALETPPGVEEHAAGLRAALAAAKSGQRVLLAVPDPFVWNALRKSDAASRNGAGQPNLANPAHSVAALSPPSGYLCRARLRTITRNPARVPPEERAALLPLVAWADRNPDGPVADGRGFSPDRARLAWSRVCCDDWADDPSAQRARDAAARAGVILVTHATLCAQVAAALGATEGALLPACDSLIVTGAHRLADTAQSAAGIGRAAGLHRLREILQGLTSPSPEYDPTAWFAPERELLKFLQTAGRHAAKQRPNGDFRVRYAEPVTAAFGADPAPVLEALRDNLELLARAAESPAGEPDRIAARLRDFRAEFASLCDAGATGGEETVYWMEDGSNPPRAVLRSAPLLMDSFGGSLRELFGAGVFLSQALFAGPQGRDARAFLRGIGLEEMEPGARRVADAAPAPRFLMAPFAPFLGSGEQAEEFARFLAEAAAPFAARGVRVFCPSQAALRALHGALRRALPEGMPLWAQHIDGNRDAVARLYASGRGGFVLAAEGMPGLRDADGKEPALWIVTRMPLPPPRDPLLEARGEILREQGGNAKLELWHPAAILRLKRDWAVLRGAETTEGTRAIWLLDGRAATEGLGARFAGALGFQAEAEKDLETLKQKTLGVFDPNPL